MLGNMQIVLAGGTGFLGRALDQRLRQAGHQVTLLTRRPRPRAGDQIAWTPDGTAGSWARTIDGADALVNLSGEGIADARWTAARKAALRDSRLLSTRSLVTAIHAAATPPSVLVSASGIGYYGDRGDQLVTEATAPGDDFLARLCVAWEREAEQASTRTRVALLRSGLVLHASGGALARMLLPFRLGVGGRLGSGRQYLPWIHLTDWLRVVEWIISTPGARGAFNATSPQPATNREFTRALAAALRRPAIIPVPAVALRIALGELADTLLTGQRAVPARAQELGFDFEFPTIDSALGAMHLAISR